MFMKIGLILILAGMAGRFMRILTLTTILVILRQSIFRQTVYSFFPAIDFHFDGRTAEIVRQVTDIMVYNTKAPLPPGTILK